MPRLGCTSTSAPLRQTRRGGQCPLLVTALTPTAVAGGLHFQTVSTSLSWFFTCGLTTGDRAYCWGGNSWGQLGNGAYANYSETPIAVIGP